MIYDVLSIGGLFLLVVVIVGAEMRMRRLEFEVRDLRNGIRQLAEALEAVERRLPD